MQPYQMPEINDYDASAKIPPETFLENVPASTTSTSQPHPPELVLKLSPSERAHAEKALTRKIDIHLLPMLILMYIMNYLDRNNIAAARLAGLQDPINDGGLNLSSTQYLTSLSILFVGYLLMQIPSNLFLNKTGKPSLYLPTCMIVWGVISAATAGAKNYGGLIAIRFCLGFVEAAYFPGCLFFLSSWYTRKQLGFRTALLYSGALLSGAFSGLISAGITNGLDGARGMRAWRWLFIIEGVITIFIAFFAYLVLPDFPRTTSWLTEDERQLAVWRLVEDIGEDDWVDSSQQTFFHGIRLAVQDIKMWILVWWLNLVPPYTLAVITTFINSWHADRTGERYFHITVPLYFSVIAFVVAATTTAVGPRPPAKRAAALAAINAISNTSSIYASYLYPASAGPRFLVAMSVNCATSFIAICSATALRFILVRLNKKLDHGEPVEGAVTLGDSVPGVAAERGFRFVL
ncbi:MAG: hypothetical protein Q9163_001138 [Psora crenata]